MMVKVLFLIAAWLLIGAVVANFTYPRWIGVPFWWAALLWPLTFRRNP
jgi:hypothetical protein